MATKSGPGDPLLVATNWIPVSTFCVTVLHLPKRLLDSTDQHFTHAPWVPTSLEALFSDLPSPYGAFKKSVSKIVYHF